MSLTILSHKPSRTVPGNAFPEQYSHGEHLAAIHERDLHLGPKVSVEQKAQVATRAHHQPRLSARRNVYAQLAAPALAPLRLGMACTVRFALTCLRAME